MFKFNFAIDNDGGVQDDNKHGQAGTLEQLLCTKISGVKTTKRAARKIDIPENVENLNDAEKVSNVEVKSTNIKFYKSPLAEDENSLQEAEKFRSDLVPGVYEGGAKIWECTFDLLEYMDKHFQPGEFSDKFVLDLGCGSGILGIYALTKGANVHFQDYNEEVIKNLTIPNVMLNVRADMQNRTKFFCGDWSDYALLKFHEKFDIILTSETIYNLENYSALYHVFKEKLKEKGQILLASKTYYFGVGGGTREFETALQKFGGLKWETVWKCNKDVSREILRLELEDSEYGS